MANDFCEYAPVTPSPFGFGAMSAAVLAGLTFSGYGLSNTAQIGSVHISGSSTSLVYAGEHYQVVSELDIEDLQYFSAFNSGMAKASKDIPGYFFDVLNDDFESFLA